MKNKRMCGDVFSLNDSECVLACAQKARSKKQEEEEKLPVADSEIQPIE
mgnify:CR=1 FL=1